jgi:hypothetical protein
MAEGLIVFISHGKSWNSVPVVVGLRSKTHSYHALGFLFSLSMRICATKMAKHDGIYVAKIVPDVSRRPLTAQKSPFE